MSKDNILFTLVGVGFGLFFGFVFVAWANQRAVQPRAQSGTESATDRAQSSIAVADQQMQSVLADAAKRARENPQDFGAQMTAGGIAYKAQQYDDALEFFLKANQLKPDEVEPVIQLGNVNYDGGRLQAAEKWYTAALLKEPDNVNVRTDLGLTFLLRDPPDYDRAIAEFRRSLERDQQHEQTLQNLVVALTRKGNKDEARATLKRLQEINPNNPTLAQLQADLQ
ncbi:MAG TPA: tetratricopeptide repeat protein [Pyrinomonadaceae bacterium]|jgi:tetratricopeptide (TPR) repeat protein